MALEDFTELEFLHKFFLLIFVIISIIIGLKTLFKYFGHHRKELITVGLAWTLMTSAWWGITINFILKLLFNSALEANIYLFIESVFIPVGLFLWIYTFCSLAYPELEKILIPIYLVICILMEILLIIFLITNPDLIGIRVSKYEYEHGLFTEGFAIFTILSAVITGVLFSKKSLKSDNAKIRWKGRFLLIAFFSFTIGVILNIIWGSTFNFLPVNPITIIVIRCFLILSAIAYYLGFFLPDKLANWLIKEDKNKREEMV